MQTFVAEAWVSQLVDLLKAVSLDGSTRIGYRDRGSTGTGPGASGEKWGRGRGTARKPKKDPALNQKHSPR